MYLTHGCPPEGAKFRRSTLTAANGDHIPCQLGHGPKGIPQAYVASRAESLDLLPLRWLCNRGCQIDLASPAVLTTPAGRSIQLAEAHDMVYATAPQVQAILDDLPPAEELGRDGQTALRSFHAHMLVSRFHVYRAHCDDALSAGPSSSIRQVLEAQQLMPNRIKRLVRAYRNIPDEYAASVGTHTADFGSWSYMRRLGNSFARPAQLWEWCAGSGRLSATATRQASSCAASTGQPCSIQWTTGGVTIWGISVFKCDCSGRLCSSGPLAL